MDPLIAAWARGLRRRQSARLAATVAGVAVAVALLATLGGFFASTEATMTRQAIAGVAVDWQIQLANGADPAAAAAELAKSPGATNVAQVGYFDTLGFEAATGGTVQSTGTGKVVGLGAGYRDAFPAVIRSLVGDGAGGVLLAQQTAANLHAVPGTVISIKRPGLPPVEVTVGAVVDLPLADSFFQTIGAPAGSAPTAPPDNVLLLPIDQWHALFDPVAQTDPNALRVQLHATVPHDLPASPEKAFIQVGGLARNYESRMAGSAVIGDNLAARLDAARGDALYARVLFLFLGLPGALLAALATLVVVASGATARRRDQALLRLRGASPSIVLRLVAVEAAIIGLIGSLLGLGLGSLAVRLNFGRWGFGETTATSLLWAALSVGCGLAFSFAMLLIPAWRSGRNERVNASRSVVQRRGPFWWERIGLDLALLAISAIVYWQAARGGYKIVLAPEGVPSVSVSYTSFLAPLLLWIGAALLAVRLTRLALARDGRLIAPLIRPIGHRLSPLIGGAMSRQRGRVATGLALVLLAVAFAASTSLFNATYQAQARVDAELSNGGDVVVLGGPAADLNGRQASIAAAPGVAAVETLQHRYAYVGADLQDLFGVNPATIMRAARLSDAFFVGDSANDAMARLAQTPDGVLVSPETVSDFQLHLNDPIRLRLQSAADGQYHVVQFRYVGSAREFPTAPKDSFLVANDAYVAAQTGNASVQGLLIKTSSGSDPAAVAAAVRTTLGPASGATTRDIGEQQRLIDSGLTSVSLRGLTRIELIFALALAATGAGLVLALGLEERRRTLAIASALGAKPRQLASFVWSEAGLILTGGLLGGLALGWGVAQVLTKLLTHVFDPPPLAMTVPWPYLALVVGVTVASVAVAGQIVNRIARRDVLETIRRL